ncbi:MAG: putative lipid II flippase FtsW [Candidatus Aadella gelida]|nr:putative lipid II flippase FtsW [Candidatus Aadella gelida]
MTRDSKIILLSTSLLLMLGVVMIYSSSAIYAHGSYEDSLFFVKRHLLFLFVGLIVALACMSVKIERIREVIRPVMIGMIILLILVLVPGIGAVAGGARRWIKIFGFGFQPSEAAKIILILYMSDLIVRKGKMIKDLKRGFIPSFFVIGLMGGLVLLEPDMGTFVAILFIGTVMLFSSGVKLKHLFSVGLCMIPALVLAVKSKPYRVKRIFTVINPWADAQGAGFQLIQSFIALGSGGILGVGLGESRQKLFYLPESHTDFIFSIIGEELGFLGAASTLILFSALIWYSFRISLKIKERFSSLAVFGVATMLAFEVIVNVGVSTGVLPTKGLPLPFISYGGSSLVCHLAAIGLVLNAARRAEYK